MKLTGNYVDGKFFLLNGTFFLILPQWHCSHINFSSFYTN